jgi:hypothetical protein
MNLGKAGKNIGRAKAPAIQRDVERNYSTFFLDKS